MKEIIFNSSWSSAPDAKAKGRYTYRLAGIGQNRDSFASNIRYPKDKSAKLIPLTGHLVEHNYIQLNVDGCYLVSFEGDAEKSNDYYASFIKDGMVLPLSDSKMSESDIVHFSEVQGLPLKYITVVGNKAPLDSTRTRHDIAKRYPKNYLIGIAVALAITVLAFVSLAIVMMLF